MEHILTNEHRIRRCKTIKLHALLDESEFDAKLVGVDEYGNCCFKNYAKEVTTALRQPNSEEVQVGQFADSLSEPFRLITTVRPVL